MSYAHINAPSPIEVGCIVNHCPTCERPRRMLYRHYEWYGCHLECAGCGDEWNDGERAERPFARGWRTAAILRVRRQLAAIGVQA